MKICKKGHKRDDTLKKCPICKKEWELKHYQENREKIIIRVTTYQEKNKEKISTYNQARKDWRKSYDKAYNQANRDILREKNKNRKREKRKVDIVDRIKFNLRCRTNSALKKQIKTGSAVRDLGCTGLELKIYLESLFTEGMSWDNYGNKSTNWSIDHIIPLSKVDLNNREEYLKVAHFTNLQPMWHVLNVKWGNKIKK